jgi:hypothetical protein
MFGDGSLTFQEFLMREPLPLATIQDAVLEFLRGVDDAALFGAQAVNAYVDEPRMTQEVDILSTQASEFAEKLKEHLNLKFHVAIRVREMARGRGFRLFQIQKTGNRHLVDVRAVQSLPPIQRLDDVQVAAPAELIASKVIAYVSRKGQPKAFTDRRDLAALLLKFPRMKVDECEVHQRLVAAGADEACQAAWRELVAEAIVQQSDDEGY